MPFFKTTENIFKDFGEHFDQNWMDSDFLVLPETKEWDYSRELSIEDVDLWELIIERGQVNLYVSYLPYAEFYLMTFLQDKNLEIKTFYGKSAYISVIKELKKFNISLSVNKIWISDREFDSFIKTY